MRMKLYFKSIFLLALLSGFIGGCNNQSQNESSNKTSQNTQPPPPPSIKLKVETYPKFSRGTEQNYLDIQVLTPDLIIQEVKVNRGSCQILNESFGIDISGPLKFGDTLTYFIWPYPVCNVAEVEVVTDLGTMVYSFK